MPYLTQEDQASLPLGPTDEFNALPFDVVRDIDQEVITALGVALAAEGGVQ